MLNTEHVEAVDANEACRAGLMLHIGTLKVVVQLGDGEQPQESPQAPGF